MNEVQRAKCREFHIAKDSRISLFRLSLSNNHVALPCASFWQQPIHQALGSLIPSSHRTVICRETRLGDAGGEVGGAVGQQQPG